VVRWLVIAGAVLGLGCGPKAAPTPLAESGPVPLGGAWFLLDTPLGPPSGRMRVEPEQVTMDTPAGSLEFSWSREDRGMELRSPRTTLLAERAGDGALMVYGSTGATSYAYPILPLDPAFLGEWLLRDPVLPAGRSLRVLPGTDQDGAARLVADGRTYALWVVQRPEGRAWVILPPGVDAVGEGRVWLMHGLDPERYLVSGPQQGKSHVLLRPGDTPIWIGEDTGQAPEGPNPWLPPVD